MHVGHAVGGVGKIVLQYACQFPGFTVLCAECKIVVLVSDADGSVSRDPFCFLRGKKRVGSCLPEVPAVHLLVIVPVFVLNPVQRHIQISQKIRAVFADREKEIGESDLAYRNRKLRLREGINGDIGVQPAVIQHLERFVLCPRHFEKLCMDVILPFPFKKEVCLDASLVYADPFPVQGRIIGR